jgi:hypothetical protein
VGTANLRHPTEIVARGLWGEVRTSRNAVRQNDGVPNEPICPLCEMPLDFCVHGLQTRQKERAASATLLISPRGMAHFAGCPHKGEDDHDFALWAELDTPGAWVLLGNGQHVQATGGQRVDLVASSRCRDCVEHGPWS